MSLAYPFRGGPVPKELRSNLHSDSCFPAEYLKPHTLASAGLGSVSQCQISSNPLSRVPVPGNLQGFEVPDSSAFHSNPRGRGKRWEEAVGMTPRADSYNLVSVCFSSTRVYQDTWFQDLQSCLRNEKSHNKREPHVWSFNSIPDHIQ